MSELTSPTQQFFSFLTTFLSLSKNNLPFYSRKISSLWIQGLKVEASVPCLLYLRNTHISKLSWSSTFSVETSQTTVRVLCSEFLHSFIHYHNLSFINSCIHSGQMFIKHLSCVRFCNGRNFTWLWTLHSTQVNDLHVLSTQHTLLTKMHFFFLLLFFCLFLFFK